MVLIYLLPKSHTHYKDSPVVVVVVPVVEGKQVEGSIVASSVQHPFLDKLSLLVMMGCF